MRFRKTLHARDLPEVVRSTGQAYYSDAGPGNASSTTQLPPEGWIVPSPVPATAGMFPLTTDAARSAINATRIAYISPVSGVAPSLGKMYYVIDGVGIVDETGSATGAGAVAYGTDPMNPTGPIVAWKHWAAVGPLAGGAIAGVRGSQGAELTNPGPLEFSSGSTLRQRSPDWWLFKRGETLDLSDDLTDYKTIATLFNATSQSLTTCGGATWLTRQVVGAYGPIATARPKITLKMGGKSINRQNLKTSTNKSWINVQYMDLYFDAEVRDPSLEDLTNGLEVNNLITLYLGADSFNILFQGCIWDGAATLAPNGAAAQTTVITISQATPGVLSTPVAANSTNATGYAIGSTSITLSSTGPQIYAGQSVLFAGDTNTYKLVTGAYANGTIVLEVPGLLQAIPAVQTDIRVGHGLKVKDRVVLKTAGTLPAGLVAGAAHWVHTVLSGTDITVKTSPEGATAIATTTAGTGAHTLEVNGSGTNHIIFHRCAVVNAFNTRRNPAHPQGIYFGGYNGRLQISETLIARNGFKYTGINPRYIHEAAVTISVGTPAAIGWTAHGLFVNDPVVFNTTGAYPAGFDVAAKAYVQYFVSAVLTPNTFSVSLTPGGAAINTTAAGSGLMKAFVDIRVAGGAVKVATVPNGDVYARNLYFGGKADTKYCWLADCMILRGSSAEQSRGGLQMLRCFMQSGGMVNGGYGGHDDAYGSTGSTIGNWFQIYVNSPAHPGGGLSLAHGAAFHTVCNNVVSHAQAAAAEASFEFGAEGWGSSAHFYSYPVRSNVVYGNHFESGTVKPVRVADGYNFGASLQLAYAPPGVTGNAVKNNVMITSAAAPEYSYVQDPLGPATNDTVYSGNVTYASRAAAQTALGGADWDRTLKTYLVSLGQTVTSVDGVDEMIALWINGMHRGNWTPAYTNRALVNYCRAGRNLGTFKAAT